MTILEALETGDVHLGVSPIGHQRMYYDSDGNWVVTVRHNVGRHDEHIEEIYRGDSEEQAVEALIGEEK